MKKNRKTFGQVILEERKVQGLSQKELAGLIKKEDGCSISAPYLNDIEHDRRRPSSHHIIEQFANNLNITASILYYAAGVIPAAAYKSRPDDARVIKAFDKLVNILQGPAA